MTLGAIAPDVTGLWCDWETDGDVTSLPMASVGAAVGIETMLLEAKSFFQTSENFLEIRPALRGPRNVRLRIGGTGGHPHLLAGILEAATHQAGEPGVRVTVVEQDGDRCVLDAAW